jgi:diguanylate cyclase (GGDEF)-like protein
MSRRTWRIDIKPDGPGADVEMDRTSGPRRSENGAGGRDGPALEPVAAESGASPWRRCRDWIVRIGRAAGEWSSGASRRRFEESVHRIATATENAEGQDDVDAALIGLARELAPRSRIALIRTRGEAADSMDGGPVGDDEAGAENRVPGWAQRPEESSVVEIPLSCGVAVHGRLRLFSPGPGRSAWHPRTLRRLVTACTMSACVLESLRRNAEWAWDGGDEVDEADRPRPSQAHSPAAARDATFLNAVLPFALSQAKRHREPASLLCLAIDRLAAIQDLLGADVADRVVQNVARKVSSLVRSSDIVARLDDNRIVVLLMRARGTSAMSVARVIGRAMSETTRSVPELPAATVSIGVAEFPTNARTAIALLDASDDALARAQALGQDQVVLADARPTAPSTGYQTAARPAPCPC